MKHNQSDFLLIGKYAREISQFSSIEEILWFTSEELTTFLGLQDCVIYRLDEMRNLLTQCAAAGPKSGSNRTIINPIQIPFGTGIVGTAIKKGSSIMVTDTAADERYVEDDAHRSSELAVPFRVNGSIQGVIDSEHDERGFYSDHHLHVFELFSAILGMRIGQLESEQERSDNARFHQLNPNPVFRLGHEGELLNANEASRMLLSDLLVSDAPGNNAQLRGYIEKALSEEQYQEFNIEVFKKSFKVQLVPVTEFNYVNLYATDVSDINEARRIAQEANDAKAEFLSIISHELRTPLNAVQGTVDLLSHTELDKVQGEYLKMLRQSSTNLTILVNDILDYERLESGKLSVIEKTFDPVDSLVTNLASFRAEARDKHVDFEEILRFPKDVQVESDELRLLQIVDNLVSNAVKYTDEGKVTVSASIDQIDGQNAIFTFVVQDTGRGIQTKDHERIFEPFTQLKESALRTQFGTGLGLSIVSRLLRQLNGEISLQSDMGLGSTFTVRIPVAIVHSNDIAAREKPGKDVHQAVDLRRMKVLVVDDNEVNVKVIEAYLRMWNAEFHAVYDGQQAISYFQESSADVVLMDIQMPVMDGFETTAALRGREESEAIPIIGLTADVTPATQARALGVGMNLLLTKPFDPQELSSLLRSYQG